MGGTAKVLDKPGVDVKYRIFVALGLYHVANRQGAHITAVLEIPRIDGLEPNLVKDLSALGPFGKDMGRTDRGCATYVFVFVVLFGSSDDPVLDHILYDLRDLGLGERQVDDQTHPVLGSVFLPRRKVFGIDQSSQDQGNARNHDPRPEATGPDTSISMRRSFLTRSSFFHRSNLCRHRGSTFGIACQLPRSRSILRQTRPYPFLLCKKIVKNNLTTPLKIPAQP